MRYFVCITFLVAISFNSWSQTEKHSHYGCHHVKHTLHKELIDPEDKRMMQRSAERSDTFDILHYDISLDLTSFEQSILYGNTSIRFLTLMDDLDYINFDLEGLMVEEVVASSTGNALNYMHDGRLLRIELDTVLQAQSEYEVRVKYAGQPITCPSGFGGFYFEDGYAYNLGIGLQASPHNFGRAWYPCFDNFIDRSTYTYRLTTNKGRVSYGLGQLVDEQNLGGDTVVRTFQMRNPIPTYLSHVAISNYSEVNYVHQGEYAAVPIRLRSKTRDTTALRKSFSPLGQVLECMEQWYGPYPFEYIGFNITTRGAMEHPTGVAYPFSSIDGGETNLGLITHELAHHWWGNITTLSSEFDMWLKEGPASYSEQQIIEYLEGKDAFEEAVRANNTRMLTIAHIADEGFWPLSPMPDAWTYGRTTYDKGAAMIHNLRAYLGDSLFKQGMQNVLAERFYESIDAAQFRDQLIAGTGYDLEPFFDDWIFSPGWSNFYVRDYSIEEEGSSTKVKFELRQGVYGTDQMHREVPVRVMAYRKGTPPHIETIMCSGEYTIDSFSTNFVPELVFANPDQHLNMASAGDLYVLQDSSYILSFTEWSLDANRLTTDSLPFHIMHHWISPEQTVPDTIPFRLSTKHFWTIQYSGNHAEQLQGRVSYEGRNEGDLDYELTANTEDSIILVYRPNASSPWLEYPFYVKQALFPTDGRGFMNLSQILPGEYSFANGPSGLFVRTDLPSIEEITLYPNPSTDFFVIDGLSEDLNVVQIDLIDSQGRSVYSGKCRDKIKVKVSTSHLPEGIYYSLLKDDKGRILHSIPVVIQ